MPLDKDSDIPVIKPPIYKQPVACKWIAVNCGLFIKRIYNRIDKHIRKPLNFFFVAALLSLLPGQPVACKTGLLTNRHSAGITQMVTYKGGCSGSGVANNWGVLIVHPRPKQEKK